MLKGTFCVCMRCRGTGLNICMWCSGSEAGLPLGSGGVVTVLLELELPELAHLPTRSEAVVTNSSWRQLDTLKHFKPFLLSLSEHRHDTQTFSQRDFNFTWVCASQINKSLHAELRIITSLTFLQSQANPVSDVWTYMRAQQTWTADS